MKNNRPIKLFHFRRKEGKKNFGDDISPIIVSEVSGRHVLSCDIHECDMIGVGSLLHAAAGAAYRNFLKGRLSRISVWGSGTLTPGRKIPNMALNILAVRGKMSLKRIIPSPKVPLGDPGLFLRYIEQKKRPKKYSVCFIPHFVDLDHPSFRKFVEQDKNSTIARVDDDWRLLTEKVQCSDLVVSTSLHGLIAADSFDIPSVWAEVSSGVIGNGWKFKDYYSSFEEKCPEPVSIVSVNHISALKEFSTTRSSSAIDDICKNLSHALRRQF